MTEITNKATDEFVQKVRDLLEAITGRSYSYIMVPFSRRYVWSVHLDESKDDIESIIGNKGAYDIEEDVDGVIRIRSDQFYDIDEVASEEYFLERNIGNSLLDRKNWEKYKKKIPGLIAELEVIEGIANEANAKHGTSIRLYARQKPYLEASFDMKHMSEGEKLHEIERHAKAMYEAWKLWDEWTITDRREAYIERAPVMKTYTLSRSFGGRKIKFDVVKTGRRRKTPIFQFICPKCKSQVYEGAVVFDLEDEVKCRKCGFEAELWHFPHTLKGSGLYTMGGHYTNDNMSMLSLNEVLDYFLYPWGTNFQRSRYRLVHGGGQPWIVGSLDDCLEHFTRIFGSEEL